VGLYEDAAFKKHGFLLTGGKYKTLDVPGSNGNTTAAAINNAGNIVLYWDDPSGNFESALYNGKTYKAINVTGATNSFAEGINTNGDVVYWWANSTGIYGALRQGTKFSKFSDPQGVGNTHAWGLNAHNQIVGYYGTAGSFHAFEANY
jgi:uncharacterized membrane protein